MGYAIAAMLLLFVFVAPGRASAAEVPVKGTARRAQVEQAGIALGLPSPWILWLVWVSKGEANWYLTAHNDSIGEKAAAGKAYDRLVAEGRWKCPLNKGAYAIGSGGWYGQLAPYTARFGEALGLGCNVKAIWHDPIASTRVHLRQVEGTLSILRSKTDGGGTFLQLRALYGLPSRDPATVDTPERRTQYAKTLKAAGIDPSFLDVQVPPFPEGVV